MANPFTGMWLRNSLKAKFPRKKDYEIAATLGVSPQAFANWGRNDGVVRLPNAETLYRGYRALGLIADPDEAGDGAAPRRDSIEWPVQGKAAADDSAGSQVPATADPCDFIRCPANLTLVPVQGDSMAPLVHSGQYVMIDREREGFERNGAVVVVTIVDPDWERRERMPGTFVKRCFGGDGFFYFTSVNSTYAPFSAWRENCHVWPVLGVWHGDQNRLRHEARAR